ncbi:MAG: nucleotide exchange factor GrpE [Candidatus Moraniibacteriota bacterium]
MKKKSDKSQDKEEVLETPEAESADQKDWQEKAQEYLDDLKRLKADFENYKKRKEASEKDLASFLTERLVLDLVPVLDNFQMATTHVPEEQKESAWVIGIQYIEKQLEEVLGKHGITPIEAKIGEPFDPTLHEAIEHEETEDKEKNLISKMHQKGYRHGERIIRPAKVSVK